MAGDKTLGPSQRAALAKAMVVTVPASGRDGDVPEWPGAAQVSPTMAQLELWRDLWSRPVAAAWEQVGTPLTTVARYVIAYTHAMTDHKWGGVAARLEKELWLTPEAMRVGRIRVVDVDGDEDDSAQVTEIDEARRRRIAAG